MASNTMDIARLSPRRYSSTVILAVIASALVIGGAAVLGRAAMNLSGALTEKPDIAIYLLLPDEEITHIEMLRETENERHYLAETKEGPKLIILKKGEKWYVSEMQKLRE